MMFLITILTIAVFFEGMVHHHMVDLESDWNGWWCSSVASTTSGKHHFSHVTHEDSNHNWSNCFAVWVYALLILLAKVTSFLQHCCNFFLKKIVMAEKTIFGSRILSIYDSNVGTCCFWLYIRLIWHLASCDSVFIIIILLWWLVVYAQFCNNMTGTWLVQVGTILALNSRDPLQTCSLSNLFDHSYFVLHHNFLSVTIDNTCRHSTCIRQLYLKMASHQYSFVQAYDLWLLTCFLLYI